MKRNNKAVRTFLRSAIMTAVVLFCITAVFLGICKSWEEIRRISFKDERPAVYFGEEGLRILDFEIELKIKKS